MKEINEVDFAAILKGLRGGIHKSFECIAHEDYVTATYNLGLLFAFADSAIDHFGLEDVNVEEVNNAE